MVLLAVLISMESFLDVGVFFLFDLTSSSNQTKRAGLRLVHGEDHNVYDLRHTGFQSSLIIILIVVTSALDLIFSFESYAALLTSDYPLNAFHRDF